MSAGYRRIGFDISWDQIRLGRRRLEWAVQADACCLPVRSMTIDVAVGMYFHTDLEDFDAVVREVARCLRPGGRFIYVGLHPCFVGPFIDRTNEARSHELAVVAGYGQIGWANRGWAGAGSG